MKGARVDPSFHIVVVEFVRLVEIAFDLGHARVRPVVDVVLSLGNADKSGQSVQNIPTLGPVYDITQLLWTYKIKLTNDAGSVLA